MVHLLRNDQRAAKELFGRAKYPGQFQPKRIYGFQFPDHVRNRRITG